MNKLKINKWLGHTFQTSSSRTPEYLAWHRDFRSALKKILPDGAELILSKPNHFDATGFVKRADRFVYFSVSDIRFWQDEWSNHVLIRTAKHDKDWTGGANNYTTLDNFTENVDRLLEGI